MKKDNEIKPIEVYSGSIWEAEMVKSLLEDAEIETFLKDEYCGTIVPWNTSPGGVGSVKVIVSTLDFEKAKIIVEEYNKK